MSLQLKRPSSYSVSPLCLYVSYDGLLDPLGQSQILPYLQGLLPYGFRFVLLSFEKIGRTSTQIDALQSQLANQGIYWYYLPFRKGRFQWLSRFIKGVWTLRCLAQRYHPNLVHARTIISAAIVRTAFLRAPLIYDIRAFAGEWIDAKRIQSGSLQARLFLGFESHLIRSSSGLVVLDQSGSDYLSKSYSISQSQIQVIPTCTDSQRYPTINLDPASSPLRFVFLGGARFPYRPDLSLHLIKQLLDSGSNCCIDFINESDHQTLSSLILNSHVPASCCRIFSVPQAEVPNILVGYHCGVVFTSCGFWRGMSSPTKLAEYLAAGLHVLGLTGINALDHLALTYPQLTTLTSESQITSGFPSHDIETMLYKIRNPNRPQLARGVAQAYYSLSLAHLRYAELYRHVLKPTS